MRSPPLHIHNEDAPLLRPVQAAGVCQSCRTLSAPERERGRVQPRLLCRNVDRQRTSGDKKSQTGPNRPGQNVHIRRRLRLELEAARPVRRDLRPAGRVGVGRLQRDDIRLRPDGDRKDLHHGGDQGRPGAKGRDPELFRPDLRPHLGLRRPAVPGASLLPGDLPGGGAGPAGQGPEETVRAARAARHRRLRQGPVVVRVQVGVGDRARDDGRQPEQDGRGDKHERALVQEPRHLHHHRRVQRAGRGGTGQDQVILNVVFNLLEFWCSFLPFLFSLPFRSSFCLSFFAFPFPPSFFDFPFHPSFLHPPPPFPTAL